MKSSTLDPKVSIIIPVYNGANYLREAIDSALNQTYKNIEVIVVNDGSNDEGKTEEIAKSYGNRIRCFHKENGGVASALNLGIRNMTGAYFSWLSHDDLYYPSKIEEQVKFLKRTNQENSVIYSDYEMIDENSRYIKNVRLKNVESKEILKALLCKSFIHGCTLLIPKRCIKYENPFNERLRSTQDYDLWCRLALDYNFIHLDKVLIKSRQHPGQGTRTFGRSHKKECNDFFIFWIKKLEERQNDYFIDDSKTFYFARLSYSLLRRRFYYSMLVAIMMSIKNLNSRIINDAGRTFRNVFKSTPR